jgi:hypothetical protein
MTAVAGGGMTAQERERRDSAAAADVLEHPGFGDVLKDAAREAEAARGVIFDDTKSEKEQSFARGSLKVLKNIVLAVYRRANKEVPPQVVALFK